MGEDIVVTIAESPVTAVVAATGLAIALFTLIVEIGSLLVDQKTKKLFYWDFFVSQYLDGTFKHSDKEIDLKDGRLIVANKNKNRSHNDYIMATLEKDPSSYENKLAHRLSVILQRVGQAAFVGDLPLSYIFSVSSEMILKDWEMAKALIGSINSPDDYKRKFGKWLACASCMYLVAYESDGSAKSRAYIKKFAEDSAQPITDYKKAAKEMLKNTKKIQKSSKIILARSSSFYTWKLRRKFSKKIKSL